MNLNIYAIIVTYNGSKWINKCFGSLVNSTIPLKILAIDNASSDGTPDMIREKFPQVEVIEIGKNLGFGRANNIGLKRVLNENADYAFLLNQDAWVEEDTIEKLVEIHQEHPEFGILSPVPYDGGGEKFDRQFSRFYCNPHEIDEIDFSETNNAIYKIPFINAAGWLITNKTIKTIGLFSNFFFQRAEDKDYSNRCRFHDINIGFVANSRYYHDRMHVWHKPTSSKQKMENIKHKLTVVLNDINTSKFQRIINFIRSIVIYHNMNRNIKYYHFLLLILYFLIKTPIILYYSENLKNPYIKKQ